MTWPSVSEYAATLDTEDFQAVLWPNQNGGQIVYAHLLRTRVKKLGACQVLIIREKQNDPNSSTRFFATTRPKDTLRKWWMQRPNAGRWKCYLRILRS